MTAAERVDQHLRRYYRTTLAEVEITDTPGYWRHKEPCGGRGACPSSAAHSAVGWESGFRHTVTYFDQGRDPATGRWVSPYRTWLELRAASLPRANPVTATAWEGER